MGTEDSKEPNAWGNAQDRAKESRAKGKSSTSVAPDGAADLGSKSQKAVKAGCGESRPCGLGRAGWKRDNHSLDVDNTRRPATSFRLLVKNGLVGGSLYARARG
jgi:hypothetical protein